MSILSSRWWMFFNLCGKNCEKPLNYFWEDMTALRGRDYLVIKINITFFVGNKVLNIFHLNIFSKKSIFSKITVKNNFWGMTIFQKTGDRTTKMNITFSMGNGVPNTVLKFFPQKAHIPAE